jgi:DNA-binding SARP family transcriptional activator
MLRICLLGGFRAYRDEVPIARFAAPRVEVLFSYLLIHRRRLWPRPVIAELFWEGVPEDSARNCLNTSLSRLRHALTDQDARADCLLVEPGFIGIDDGRRPCWMSRNSSRPAERQNERTRTTTPGSTQ